MNPKFRELAEQAKMSTYLLAYGLEFNTSVERFAELILQECVRYFNEDYQRDFNAPWREDLTKGVKQHFGVAE